MSHAAGFFCCQRVMEGAVEFGALGELCPGERLSWQVECRGCRKSGYGLFEEHRNNIRRSLGGLRWQLSTYADACEDEWHPRSKRGVVKYGKAPSQKQCQD
jgi:hypothetical protein